jgi:hypothetical protein
MSSGQDLPEVPLEFKGKKAILKTSAGEIKITDFKVNIADNVSAICKCKSIPDDYRHEIPSEEYEKLKKMLKDIIPEDQLSKMKYLDKLIPNEDIIEFKLTDENGWEIELSNMYCGLERNTGEYVLDIQAINVTAKKGTITDSETVKLYKTLECFGDKKKINSINSFTPKDLANLKFLKKDISGLEYSIGYFLLEDTYENINDMEEELTDNLHYLLSLFVANFVSLRISILIGQHGIKITASPINKSSGKGSSIFYYSYGQELSNFLDSTYENYVKFKDSLDLKAVFRHYIRMKGANHTELILLMGSVLMECLKYHYARDKGYIEFNNSFIKPSANHKLRLTTSGKYKVKRGFRINRSDKYNFRELIEEIYNEFNVTHTSTDFITHRNEVIHQGTFELPYKESQVILKDLEKSITETIFNILQFKGLYSELDTYEWVTYTSPKI